MSIKLHCCGFCVSGIEIAKWKDTHSSRHKLRFNIAIMRSSSIKAEEMLFHFMFSYRFSIFSVCLIVGQVYFHGIDLLLKRIRENWVAASREEVAAN